MKKSLLFLSFLLFNSFLSFAAEEPNPVLNIEGEEIRAGVEYYIVSTIRGAGGGDVFATSIGNESCPLAVVQAQLDVIRGQPVTFTPVNPEEGVIRVSTDLNIKFSKARNICNESNVWKPDYDEELGRSFIVTNGVEGSPGCETIDNWFKIEQLYPLSSKLVFCPTVCRTISVICQDVGIFFDQNGGRRLTLSDVPFTVFFIKATSMKNGNILKSVTST